MEKLLDKTHFRDCCLGNILWPESRLSLVHVSGKAMSYIACRHEALSGERPLAVACSLVTTCDFAPCFQARLIFSNFFYKECNFL